MTIFNLLLSCLILTPIYTLQVQDYLTHEPLIGVKITTQYQIYYTNLQGYATIPIQDTIIQIEYISYTTLHISKSQQLQDTIFYLH